MLSQWLRITVPVGAESSLPRTLVLDAHFFTQLNCIQCWYSYLILKWLGSWQQFFIPSGPGQQRSLNGPRQGNWPVTNNVAVFSMPSQRSQLEYSCLFPGPLNFKSVYFPESPKPTLSPVQVPTPFLRSTLPSALALFLKSKNI